MNSKNILRSSLSRASVFIIFLLLYQTFAAAEEENWNWLKAEDLEIKGTGWPDSSETFTRLPNRAKEIVRPPVWNLSRDSTGLYVDFTTESPALRVRWSLLKERLKMNHMPATGVSGLDLYYRHEDKWRFVAVGRPAGPDSNEVTFFENLPEEKREFRLYLPLY